MSNVGASCLTNYAVGGLISGLTGTVVLQNNGGCDLSLSFNEFFYFTSPVADSHEYDVSVLSQPTGPQCIVSLGSGTISGGDINTITVACVDNLAPTITIGNPVVDIAMSPYDGNIYKNTSDGSFTLPVTTNSSGTLSYNSSATGVATIVGTAVNIVGIGDTTLTVNQAADDDYSSGSQSVILNVRTNSCALVPCKNGGTCTVTQTVAGAGNPYDTFSCNRATGH